MIYKDKLEGYIPTIRPVLRVEDAVNVEFDVNLKQLYDLVRVTKLS